jgi:glycosyltransferase involved in cell wall biosynthesis
MAKPVVAYDVGGVFEAIREGETGYTVSSGDVQHLADKILELIGNAEKRARMGECGRKFVMHNFSLLGLVKRHEEFYYKCLLKDGDNISDEHQRFLK